MTYQIICAVLSVLGAGLFTREMLSLVPRYQLEPMRIRGKKIGGWVFLLWFIGANTLSEVHFVQPLILRILLFTVLPAALVWLAVWLTRTMRTATSAPTVDDAN